ncbi:MAG: glycoside hydrolase family 30 beta sandwich domain-containing protein [Planctomycetota bacterium]
MRNVSPSCVLGAALSVAATPWVWAQAPTSAQVWLTRGDGQSLLEQRLDVNFAAGAGNQAIKVNIDPTTTFQTIDGFGAAITESSAWLLQTGIDASQRDQLMADLFSRDTGLGFSYVRVPMGASDFALSPYTYADVPTGQTDPTLSTFSVARDDTYVVPTLQQAKALNPELKLMASPWSPPAWMKTNGSLNGGSLKTEYYDAYAQYFVKFAEAYEQRGLPIASVTPQNEPLNPTPNYPSMSMTTFEQSTFIGDHLGPAFQSANLDIDILTFDHNWEDWNYPVIVANDLEANPFVAGAAFHGYAGTVDQQSNFQSFFPDKQVHYTEITGFDPFNDFADNLAYAVGTSIIGATRNWAESSIYWNLVLDPDGDPHLDGGCSTCRGMVTIDPDTGTITPEVEYYAYGHASKFVDPGAVRIASDTIDGVIETVAFKNPDGSEVLIALNPGQMSRWFNVVREGESFQYRLTSESVATFVWEAAAALALLGDYDGDGLVAQGDLNLVLSNWGSARGDWQNAEGFGSAVVQHGERSAREASVRFLCCLCCKPASCPQLLLPKWLGHLWVCCFGRLAVQTTPSARLRLACPG